MSAQAVRNLLRVDSLSESTFGDEGIRQTKESVGPRYRGGPRSLPGNARSGATGQSGTPMIPAPIPMGADGTLVRNLGCFRLPTGRSVLTPQAASPSIAIMISKTLDPRRIDGLKVEKVKLDCSVRMFRREHTRLSCLPSPWFSHPTKTDCTSPGEACASGICRILRRKLFTPKIHPTASRNPSAKMELREVKYKGYLPLSQLWT